MLKFIFCQNCVDICSEEPLHAYVLNHIMGRAWQLSETNSFMTQSEFASGAKYTRFLEKHGFLTSSEMDQETNAVKVSNRLVSKLKKMHDYNALYNEMLICKNWRIHCSERMKRRVEKQDAFFSKLFEDEKGPAETGPK